MSFLGTLERLGFKASLQLPRAVREPLTGPPPTNDRGATLDFDTWWLLWMQEWVADPIGAGTPEQARTALHRAVGPVEGPPEDLARIESLEVAGRDARLYAPSGASLPILLFLHGGGWTVGDLRTHDRHCQRLAREGQCIVVSLDYRLAPEHPFPAALEDASAALLEVRERADELGGDPGRVGMGGDSAGGNLTAVVCQQHRDAGQPMPDLQVLIYPGVDLRRQRPSHELFAEGFLLTADYLDWYMRHYQGPDPTDPQYSPLLADDLSGLPPAIVTTAGFDPLRDEGEAYAEALEEAGVEVRYLHASDLIHGYINMDGALDAADREVARLCSTLRQAWDGLPT